ncbi:MAG TPA: integrase core domain-containing protein [Terracidiphilus sp.]|nr:integrase core domain-containing protein [Terracidiphilus sp.]
MDFFTVPTLTFGVLYCFFVIAHDRRRILHFNVTRHPTSAWVVQQLREAFPYDSALGYLIFDRGTNFSEEVIDALKSFGIEPKRTSFRSPWQNGVAERWVGACRQDLLDNVIVLNERHLKRLMNEYVRYYHEDRMHLALAKETPAGRKAEDAARVDRSVISTPRLGGLQSSLRTRGVRIRSFSPCTSLIDRGETALCDPFRRIHSLYQFAKIPSFLTKTVVIPACRLSGPARERLFVARWDFGEGQVQQSWFIAVQRPSVRLERQLQMSMKNAI